MSLQMLSSWLCWAWLDDRSLVQKLQTKTQNSRKAMAGAGLGGQASAPRLHILLYRGQSHTSFREMQECGLRSWSSLAEVFVPHALLTV